MISGPGFRVQHLDEVTRQQVRPGTVRRIWPYLRQYRGPMVLLVGITAVDSAILVVIPLILRLIIDDGILRHRESVVVTLALTVAGLALVDAGAEYVRSWYSVWIGEVSCPTRYETESSSINLRRSIRYGLGVLHTCGQYQLRKHGLRDCPYLDFDPAEVIARLRSAAPVAKPPAASQKLSSSSSSSNSSTR